MLNVAAVNSSNVSGTRFRGSAEGVTGKGVDSLSNNNVDKTPSNDVFESKAKADAMTKEDKQEVVRSARQTASGWSMFGGFISTLYFGLRSDKTVAEKYNLDAEKDKKLIKQIKREQTLWTLPAAIPGVGLAPSLAAYIYNRNMDASKINVE